MNFCKRVKIAKLIALMELNDEELIAGCRNGDEAAWETLIRRYRRLIYAVPRRLGLNEDEAGEIFQQVFAILVQNLDRIKQPSRIQAWLVTTARRETLGFLTKRQKVRQLKTAGGGDEIFDELLNLPDERALPDDVLLKMEMQNRVRMAVESLDEKCRRLLEMLFYEQDPPLPYAQIAADLGISRGSIGPMRARCLRKAMDRLKR